MTFLLLRPQAKCLPSAKALTDAGLKTLACGLIETQLDHQAIAQLPGKIAALTPSTQVLYVIITSTVAAQQTVLLKARWPNNVEFFAVGSSSAQILQDAGMPCLVPSEARTEGLLALSELTQVANKTIVIIKGYGGRELLFDRLSALGASVQEWEVYKRVKVSPPTFTQDWQGEQIHCIIATSGEVIQAAFDYFDPQWLIQLPWIVVSQRTADIAATLGVSQIQISRDASDRALITTAQQFLIHVGHSSEH